jgi:hypothetical protein
MVGALATLLDKSDVSLRGTRREANTVPGLEKTPYHFIFSQVGNVTIKSFWAARDNADQ